MICPDQQPCKQEKAKQSGEKIPLFAENGGEFAQSSIRPVIGRYRSTEAAAYNSKLTSLEEAAKMMRLNIICADEMNTELHSFLSQNAEHNLSRAEGILNMAIVGNRIVIPPLYGSCYLAEIRRYEGVIRFIERAFCAGEQMREGARFLRI